MGGLEPSGRAHEKTAEFSVAEEGERYWVERELGQGGMAPQRLRGE